MPPGKEWMASAVVPLVSDEGDADFSRLRQVVGSARVVALGEIVHRAHELLAFRNELFRYLVEEEGFRTIALETDLVQSQILQDYVGGGAVNWTYPESVDR